MSYIAAAVPTSKKIKKEDVFLGKVLEYTLINRSYFFFSKLIIRLPFIKAMLHFSPDTLEAS